MKTTIGVLAGLLVAASPAAAGTHAHFRSPSGNINCRVDTTFADCLVKENDWAHLPSKPANCDLDFFPAELILSRRGVHIGSCRGDIGPLCGPFAGDRCTVLKYGKAIVVGKIRCTSAASGITCRWRTGRHIGFRIAREGYVIYR